jgi:hypothetical protein
MKSSLVGDYDSVRREGVWVINGSKFMRIRSNLQLVRVRVKLSNIFFSLKKE